MSAIRYFKLALHFVVSPQIFFWQIAIVIPAKCTNFCTRLNELQRAVSNFYSSKLAFAEHVCLTSHKIAWEDSNIITTINRYGQRLCFEACHVIISSCALNRDGDG